MKHEFAKIFSVGDHQVLVTKDYDTDQGNHLLIENTLLHGITHLGAETLCINQEQQNELFSAYSQKNAEAFLEEMITLNPLP